MEIFTIILNMLFLTGSEEIVRVEHYIENHKDIAMVEMRRTGIPASIKLAQAILESRYGTSSFAKESNNHFGIKCKQYWKGHKYYHKDDDNDKNGNLIKSCFRAYDHVWDSYIDHSNFLQGSIYYEPLFRIDKKNYKDWALSLQREGYATDKAYAHKLINIIEKHKLFRFDSL